MPPVFGKEMIKPFMSEGLFNLSILSKGADFYLNGLTMRTEKIEFYFTTRELIMMAAFAALGGIASTYINMIGDLFQSFLGFAGTTQWAAGLHVVWLMLAAVIIKKPGTATTAGMLKGAVEFFSGNTHGLLVVIVDILAGILIDVIFLANRKGSFNLWFYLAAGISSASNIFVFQLFASVPSDILTILVIGAVSAGAFISGVVFGGILVRAIYMAVQKAGLIPHVETKKFQKKTWAVVILSIAFISLIALCWVYISDQGMGEGVAISGNVKNSYVISANDLTMNRVEITALLNDVERSYVGVRLVDLIQKAQPLNNKGILLVKATDGYSFFITLDEVYSNTNLILTHQKVGNTNTVNVVGAVSSKAWIRGVSEIFVSDISMSFAISGNIQNPFNFVPEEWQQNMDSFLINTEDGSKKLQGVPLQELISVSSPEYSNYEIKVISTDDSVYSIPSQLLGQQGDAVRIFIVTTDFRIQYLLGNTDGVVLLENISGVEIN